MEKVRAAAPYLIFAIVADLWCLSAQLSASGWRACATLDDVYIHFQYARSIAELHPFAYQAGDVPTTGATSLLYVFLLAPFWAIGFRGAGMLVAANILAICAFAILAWAARSLARSFGLPSHASWAVAIAACISPAFMGAAFSGMEVGIAAAAMMSALHFATRWTVASDRTTRAACVLVTVGVIATLSRPEGVFVACAVSLALLMDAPKTKPWVRVLAILPVAAAAIPTALARSFSGEASTTGQLLKWLPADPYLTKEALRDSIVQRANDLWNLLRGGSMDMVPYPSTPSLLPLMLLVSFAAIGVHTVRVFGVRRGLILIAMLFGPSLGVLGPTTYLWFGNLGRYLMPFWPILALVTALGFATLCVLISKRVDMAVIVTALVALMWLRAPLEWRSRYAKSAVEICTQHVRMASEIAKLPVDSVIALNDAGAITFLSGRRTYDMVGLTTARAVEPYKSGDGSVFERMERLAPSRRPTHLAYYPSWLPRLNILGELLFTAEVRNANNVGDPIKELREIRTELFKSAESPTYGAPQGRLVDRLDTADVESEREHRYRMENAQMRRTMTLLHRIEGGEIADGAREHLGRETFELSGAPGRSAEWITRMAAPRGATVRVKWNGRELREMHIPPTHGWIEYSVTIEPADVFARNQIERSATAEPVAVLLHDWVYETQ